MIDIKKNKWLGVVGAIVIVPCVYMAVQPWLPQKSREETDPTVIARNKKLMEVKAKAAGMTVTAEAPAASPVQPQPAETSAAAPAAPVVQQEAEEFDESNPFVNKAEQRFFDEEPNMLVPLKDLVCSKISYAPSTAVINGRIVREGDMIGTMRVVHILPESVVLEEGKAQCVVKLRGAGGRK